MFSWRYVYGAITCIGDDTDFKAIHINLGTFHKSKKNRTCAIKGKGDISAGIHGGGAFLIPHALTSCQEGEQSNAQ